MTVGLPQGRGIVTETWLAEWFVHNYIQQCAHLWPGSVSRLFDNVRTSADFEKAFSLVVRRRLTRLPLLSWGYFEYTHHSSCVSRIWKLSKRQWRGNDFYIGEAGADQNRYLKSSKLYCMQYIWQHNVRVCPFSKTQQVGCGLMYTYKSVGLCKCQCKVV